jgi:hypothetical protein
MQNSNSAFRLHVYSTLMRKWTLQLRLELYADDGENFSYMPVLQRGTLSALSDRTLQHHWRNSHRLL